MKVYSPSIRESKILPRLRRAWFNRKLCLEAATTIEDLACLLLEAKELLERSRVMKETMHAQLISAGIKPFSNERTLQ